MKLMALAVDVDGTIAVDDVLDPEARSAIGELRQHGVRVILATGRSLASLRAVAGDDLTFADAIVAENGAVLEFPGTGYRTIAGSVPPHELVEALDAAGIRTERGTVVLGAAACDAFRLLEIVRRLELPWVLVFNRSRVMLLPQAISKATGLRQVLAAMRLSPHNAVAIGDAENDHDLLRACELGVAVSWGSDALKARADVVLDGTGPASVASFIRQCTPCNTIPTAPYSRHHIQLGTAEDGTPIVTPACDGNILVAGDPKSGKSWVAGLMCEQLIMQGYCVCVIDPEGDYLALENLPGVTVLGGAEPLPRPRELSRLFRHADVSVVIDLSHAAHAEKAAYLQSILPTLATLRRFTGVPHQVLLDEAHYFLQDPRDVAQMDVAAGGYTFVSYRASRLHPDVLSGTHAVVVTRESDPFEVQALGALCGAPLASCPHDEAEHLLGSLAAGHALLLTGHAPPTRQLTPFRLAARLTQHVRHLAKYIDIPVQESRAFVFWRDGVQTARRARTLKEFVTVLEEWPAAALGEHLQRGDFSQWILGVFGDHTLGTAIRQIEEEFRAGRAATPGLTLARIVRERYDVVAPAARA